MHELSSLGTCSREKPCRDSENEQIRILFEREKEHILDDFRAEIQKHEFQADSGGRSIQELNDVATQKTSKSGFSLNDKKSIFSMILKQRFKNTSFKPILVGEVFRN